MGEYLVMSNYIVPFIIAVIVSAFFTIVVRRFALKKNITDCPESAPERKVQTKPIPLLGGIAVFLSVVVVVAGYAFFSDRVLGGYLQPKYLIGIFIAGLLLMIGGYLEDKYDLKPSRQILWPIIACIVIIASGIGIEYITNPFGGVVYLESVQLKVFTLDGIPYYFVLFADIFAFLWLMGMMYTTKFLDGLDGLVTGITTIGAFVLFFLSLNQDVAQPETALLAIILAGATVGFLVFNFHPAKIFLGEGGSLLTGFLLGVLSIISGAKIATALLIMSIPILDVAWVIIRRLFYEKKSPFTTADNKHLHYRLLDIGLTHRKAVVVLYLVSLIFGGIALFLESWQKFIALLLAFVIMVITGVFLVCKGKRVMNN